MKRRIVTVVLFLSLFILVVPAGLSAQESGTTSGFFWSFDPLGFLTVGPAFELGGYFAENHQLAARIRLTALGLVPQLIVKSEIDRTWGQDDKWMMPWSFGIDAVYTGKSMFSKSFGVYYGGSIGLQRSDVRDYWFDDVPDETDYRYWISWHVPVMAIVGAEIKARRNPKMYFRFGVTAGVAIGVKETYYKPDSNNVHQGIDDPVNSYFIGALQAIMGWRF